MTMKITNLLATAMMLLVTASFCNGQFITASISRASLLCNGGTPKLEVQFDKSLLTLLEDARKTLEKAPDNAKPLALKNLKSLYDNIMKLNNTAGVSELNIIQLNTSSQANDGGAAKPVMFRYTVRSNGLIGINTHLSHTLGDTVPDVLVFAVNGFAASKDSLGLVMQDVTKNPSMTAITVDPSCKPLPTSMPTQTQAKDLIVPDRRLTEKLDADVTKEDANLMLDFSVDGTKRSATVRKNAFATFGVTVVPARFTKLGFHGIYEIQPFFLEVNYKATTDKTTFISNMGAKLTHLFVFGDDGRGYSNKEDKRQIVPGISTTITAKLEIERFFKSTNLVGEFQSGIPFNIMQSRAWKLRIEPSIGIATGRNLNQPDDVARTFTILTGSTASPWIARPFVNGELLFEGWRDRFFKPILTISYRRAFPLYAEAFLDSKGKSVAGYSRIVRDYVTAKVSMDAGKLLTPFFSYERGRQSPGYVLVDSKFRVGIGVKFKGKDR